MALLVQPDLLHGDFRQGQDTLKEAGGMDVVKVPQNSTIAIKLQKGVTAAGSPV